MERSTLPQEVALVINIGLTSIPLKLYSNKPVVRWRVGWSPIPADPHTWAGKRSLTWGVRCDENFALIDCDSDDTSCVAVCPFGLPAT